MNNKYDKTEKKKTAKRQAQHLPRSKRQASAGLEAKPVQLVLFVVHPFIHFLKIIDK
jgi:hypothetical protein